MVKRPSLKLSEFPNHGARFLLAVSGGRDSMCMLQLFSETVPLENIAVASVHHGLRGEEADADLELVREFSTKLGVSFYPIYLDIKELQGKGGFEARARNARYRELQTLRQRLGLDFICTAHHKQDQVETLLLRILRGTGLWGMRGILKNREDKVLRPLLDSDCDALAEYAKEKGVPWRTDSTNADPKYKRNQVRQFLVPYLNQNIPDFEEQLLRVAILVHRLLPRIAQWELSDLASLPPSSELRRLWYASHGNLMNVGKMVAHCTNSSQHTQVGGQTTVLDRPMGSISWGANMYLLTWKFRDDPGRGEMPDPSSGIFWVDVSQLKGAPVLRSRCEGDLFTPPGLRCKHRKLKKYLQEVRIPLHNRNALPLVAFGTEVLWVGGYAVSGNYQMQSQTRTVLELRLTTCHRKTP